MVRRKVNRAAAQTEPYRIWNAYVDLLAMSERADLGSVQLHAHLAFWYDCEVQNGGHMQYFLNKGIGDARDAVTALAVLKADAQRQILEEAIQIYQNSDIDDWETAEEYDAVFRRDDFCDLDTRYYKCRPEVTELLQGYLDAHVEEFVEFTDEPVPD